jgi:hypothetical protein
MRSRCASDALVLNFLQVALDGFVARNRYLAKAVSALAGVATSGMPRLCDRPRRRVPTGLVAAREGIRLSFAVCSGRRVGQNRMCYRQLSEVDSLVVQPQLRHSPWGLSS